MPTFSIFILISLTNTKASLTPPRSNRPTKQYHFPQDSQGLFGDVASLIPKEWGRIYITVEEDGKLVHKGSLRKSGDLRHEFRTGNVRSGGQDVNIYALLSGLLVSYRQVMIFISTNI